MKKFFLSLAAVILLAVPSVQAQETAGTFTPYQEIEIGAGLYSIPQVALVMGAVFGTVLTGGLFSVDNLSMSSAISAEYYYNLKPHFAVGGAAVFDSMWGDQMNKDLSTGEREYAGKFSGQFISVMPAVKFAWFSEDHIKMYSKVAAGGMVSNIPSDEGPDLQLSPAFQLSPICITAGGGHCWGKLEAGFGMMGLIQAGFVYRL